MPGGERGLSGVEAGGLCPASCRFLPVPGDPGLWSPYLTVLLWGEAAQPTERRNTG